MAKMHKLTKGGQTIYPATITDAVVNPISRKSLATELSELESNIGISFSKEILFTRKNATVINNTGNFISYAYGSATDYIEVGEMKSVSIHNLITEINTNVAVSFYDAAKSFISSIPYTTKNKLLAPMLVVFPERCKYFAASKQSSSNSDDIKIYTSIKNKDLEPIKTKADIGSIFGSQVVAANGESTKIVFKNTFKKGDIIHLVNLTSEANTYWNLKGYRNGIWNMISSRMFAGITVNRDVSVPENIETYEKIAIETDSKLILSGHGYYVTDLTLSEIEKIRDITKYINQLRTLPIIEQDVLLKSDNLINPTKVTKLGNGWWVSDYIPVFEGDIYYSNATIGLFTYDRNKIDITSEKGFVSGEPIQMGIAYVRVKLGTSGVITSEELAIDKAASLWLSKKNKESSYASQFNPYLINPIDQGGRALISKLMPHVGKKIFCVGDSYTMQGKYFPALLEVTGLNKIGDTGKDGNGQPLTWFPQNIIKNKELILQSDFVTILGGTNDYGHGGDILGTINDCIKNEYAELKIPILKLNEAGYYVKDDSIDTSYKVLTEEDINEGRTPQSLYAAIMTCVNIIHNWNKGITVVLCSQPERLPYGSQPCTPPLLRNGMNMNLIAKAMREIHEMFGVPYYDFHSNGWTIDQVEVYMNDGTLHPNEIGGRKIGRGLGMYINSL